LGTTRLNLSDTSDINFVKNDFDQAIINALNDTANTTYTKTKLPDTNKYPILLLR